ncbi:Craniofacial development protein 1 [Chamberlinius hualienensis]
MDVNEVHSDDTSDDDYVPGKGSGDEVGSEASDEGVDSDATDNDEETGESKASRKRKLSSKTKKTEVSKSFKRKGGITLEGEAQQSPKDEKTEVDANENSLTEESQAIVEEKERERANLLWQDFMKDTESKHKQSTSILKPATTPSADSSIKLATKEFNFAGEIVRITETESDNQQSQEVITNVNVELENEPSSVSSQSTNTTVKKPGGLNSVLNRISGMKKMSTLEKSRFDWNMFKQDEGISEDLKSFNRGKNGYLEKQAFLQRADERQFEIEKSFRSNKSKR